MQRIWLLPSLLLPGQFYPNGQADLPILRTMIQIIKQGQRWFQNKTGREFIVLMDEDADGVCATSPIGTIWDECAAIWFSPKLEFLTDFRRVEH